MKEITFEQLQDLYMNVDYAFDGSMGLPPSFPFRFMVENPKAKTIESYTCNLGMMADGVDGSASFLFQVIISDTAEKKYFGIRNRHLEDCNDWRLEGDIRNPDQIESILRKACKINKSCKIYLYPDFSVRGGVMYAFESSRAFKRFFNKIKKEMEEDD